MLPEMSDDAAFRSHWLALPLGLFLTDHQPDRPPITILIETGDQPLLIETIEGGVRVRPGTAPNPDVTLGGSPQAVLGVLTGRLDLAAARQQGLKIDGDPEALGRVQALPEAIAE
jgi:hypothetical protein